MKINKPIHPISNKLNYYKFKTNKTMMSAVKMEININGTNM